jgi:hypothetical protein
MPSGTLASESIAARQPADGEGLSARRLARVPSPTVPLLHFAGAHACLAIACGALVAAPGLTDAFVYHPRVLALVHLVTLGWISGSILGALYIVVPLAFGASMRAGRADAWACGSFWAGTAVMVSGFWQGRYDVVGAGSLFVLAGIAVVGARVLRALAVAPVPGGVALHVVLAFVNVGLAGGVGVALAANRATGWIPVSPLSLAAGHAHLAVLGWAVMMILGVAYRLIPMFVPAVMPSGRGLAASAILLEIGVLGLATSLALGGSALPWLPFVAGALACFVAQVRRLVRQRRPRPVDLPPRDWSTWQTHLAMAWLLVAAALGIAVALGASAIPVLWAYGTAGVLGFAGQMVLGIGGRLLPMHAWYRALERGAGTLPARSVHALIAPRLALAVLVAWAAGLPIFTAGLVTGLHSLVALGAAALLAGVLANAGHVVLLLQRAASRDGRPGPPTDAERR